MNRNFLIGGGVVFLAVVVVATYFFMRGNATDDLLTQKIKLEEALNIAEDKLNSEKENLDNLTASLQGSYPLAVSIQGQMKASSEMVNQTDFMFTNADGADPKLIIKNFGNSVALNEQRKNINVLLARWRGELDLLSIEKIDAKESEKIKKDIEAIKAFIAELTKAVQALTPENSGLSQYQIDTYISMFPSLDAVNQVLVSVETSIAIYNNAGANVSSNQPDPITPLFTPTVTPSDVVTQQSVVEQAQNQVTTLQEQLSQIELQIQQSSGTPPPTVTDETQNHSIEDQDTNFSTPDTPYTREKINSQQGIIIQPGPPKLIQGTDPY